MADLVIDEWLWADLFCENGIEKQKETFRFLSAVFRKCDRIVTVKGSGFQQKAVALWRRADVMQGVTREVAKFYKAYFWYNSDKAILLEENQLHNLPPAINVNIDDQYLIQAYLTAQASVVITTDNPLVGVLANHGIICMHRDKFVPNYISQYGQG